MFDINKESIYLVKHIIITLCVLLLLPIINISADEELTLNKKFEELSPKFTYETGECLVDNLLIEYSYFNRGDEVIIVDEDDDYYYIDNNSLITAIKKEFIRTEKEEPFNEYTAYTRNGSKLYSDLECINVIASFSLNDEINVIDAFNGLLLVKYNDLVGYMYPSNTSETKIKIYVAPQTETNVTDSSSSSGSSSGGSSSGGGGNLSSGTQGDGESFSLSKCSNNYEITFLVSSNYYKGTILADNTLTYLNVFNRNDEVKILDEIDDEYQILVGGYKGFIKTKYVRKDTDERYTAWDGYAYANSGIYSDYNLKNKISSCSVNSVIHIVDKIDDILVVELNDGEYAYMSTNKISESKIQIYVAPKVEEVVDTSSSSSSHHSSGGSSGGGSSESSDWGGDHK